ncbi:unnamed protein product [Closterium sp. NIES-54]
MLVMGVGADEELAIGAGADAVAVAFASVGVAAAAVVSATADVDAAVVFEIWWVRPSGEVDNRVYVSSSLIWDEVKNEDVVLQDRFPDVKSSLPVVRLELLNGAVDFKVNSFCHELADAE